MMPRLGRWSAFIFVVAGMAIAPASAEEAAAEGSVKVILLTGFEPFGPGRPANPSWEGIKDLDGRDWRGYRLICREMKVEWGAPLEQLAAWIEELRPVAVFSFGQGGADGFAIETLAQNERAPIADNAGQAPPTTKIDGDGPAEYQATGPAKKLAATLSKQFPIRLSTEAGGYLCEECLYTLESLKARRQAAREVLFCHVPPLGATVGTAPVDAAYVQAFVESLLAAWVAETATPATSVAPTVTTLRQAAEDPRDAEVRELIEHYFRTWSAKDLERYGQCFMPQAAIQLMDPDGRLTTMPLRAFLEGQREAHRATPSMTETPEKIEIRFEAKLARVVVYWKLVAGGKVQYGYDHFTLMQSRGAWRIANLIFYETPVPSK
jgi:pyroglutamyl-peptidase